MGREHLRPLINASQQLGGALGLAIFSAIATARTNHQLAANVPVPEALTSGFQRALLVSCVFLLAAAVVGLRASNTRGEVHEVPLDKDLTPQPMVAQPSAAR